MSRHSRLVSALLIGTSILTPATRAPLAQTAAPSGAAAPAAAAPAEQSRRGRERRRAAESTEPATAAPPAAEAASTPLQADVIDQRMICKNIKLTGTNISRRICGTPEQWAAQDKKTTDDAQEAMRQVRDRSSIVVTQPGNQPTGLGGN